MSAQTWTVTRIVTGNQKKRKTRGSYAHDANEGGRASACAYMRSLLDIGYLVTLVTFTTTIYVSPLKPELSRAKKVTERVTEPENWVTSNNRLTDRSKNHART